MSDSGAETVPTAVATDAEKSQPRPDHAAPHDYLDAVTEQGLVEDSALVAKNPMQRWAQRLEQLAGLEARGIERVPESMRAQKTAFADYVQMCLIWFSANLTANNLTIGLLGPSVFYLGLKEAMVIGTFGTLLGSMGTGYISSFGPKSGNRTLVFARYTMGWWPSKLCVLLNIVIMLGYGLIDCLISGQILSAVAGGSMTVIVGTIISAIITLVVAFFGIRLFHIYERYAFLPQACVMFILAGVAGPYFAPDSPSTGTSVEITADRMSFFFLCVSAPIAWAPAGCDFYVYFPPSAKRWAVFACTTIGLGLSSIFVVLLGVGLASGATARSDWADASDVSAGALIQIAFAPLGAFGNFCSVIVALGLIANNIPGTYSASICVQILGRGFAAVPRVLWSILGVIVYTVCACAGRNHLYEVFEDFLALMGYWVAIWIAITIEEELIFRKGTKGYDWRAWNCPDKLPLGLAALAAFLIGWVGAILCMWQVYFTGPISRMVGEGIDMGMPVGASWAALTYPGLRWLELKFIGR